MKCVCNSGNFVDSIRDPILCSFGLGKHSGYKIKEEPITRLPMKINKSVLCQITFYLEDDDQKPVHCSGVMKTFTCQLNEG